MVQFNLPKNSKILKGQYFKDKTGSSNLKIVHVYRWDPEKNENPREDTFEVNLDTCGNKVLDILNKIKNEIDSSLTFRRSCAHGVCGSCAMNIDGINTLSCMKSHKDIKGDIRIFPLPHLKVVKDLVADLSTLYRQYESIEPWLKTKESKSHKNEINQSKENRQKLDFANYRSSRRFSGSCFILARTFLKQSNTNRYEEFYVTLAGCGFNNHWRNRARKKRAGPRSYFGHVRLLRSQF